MLRIANILISGVCDSVADNLRKRVSDFSDAHKDFRVLLTEDYSVLNNLDADTNLVIITDGKTCEEITSEIIKNANLFAISPEYFITTVVKIPPEIICPTQTIRDFCYDIIEDYRKEIRDAEKALESVVSVKDGLVYALDGHHRLVATCMERKPFIRCRIEENNKFISVLSSSDYYDYEDMAGVSLPICKIAKLSA